MNYKRTNIIILLIFALIIACPLVLTNTDPDAISYIDNKTLADDPLTAMKEDEELTFTDALDDYINDRIGFRTTAIEVNSHINYYAFGKSPTDTVVFGQDGWLFYDDGSTLNQASGYLTWYPGEMELVGKNLMQMKEYLEERGCELVLYLAPNKERVYYDLLPEYYQEYRLQETCNTEQIIDYLRENTDIKVVWPYEDIKEYMEEDPDHLLYYKLDTHWNKLGGYIGAKALLNELGIEIPDLKDQTITEEDLDYGDLYERLGLYPELDLADKEYYVEGYDYVANDMAESDFYGNWTYTNTGKDSRKIMIMRDSYCTNMADYIANEFDQVNMIHHSEFDTDMIDEIQPDVFVYELVERNDFFLCRFTFGNEEN